MSVLSDRLVSSRTSKSLRRARALYGFIVAPYIIEDKSRLKSIAERAVEAGLYSEKTLLSDVAFSLVRHSFKRCGGGLDWWAFCDSHGLYYEWFNQCKKKKGYRA